MKTRGSTHAFTEARAVRIRELIKSGVARKDIAASLGVSVSLIAHYCSPRSKAAYRAGIFNEKPPCLPDLLND